MSHLLRPYFSVQKMFHIDGFTVKSFFDSIADLMPNIIIFSQQIIISNQKIHPLSTSSKLLTKAFIFENIMRDGLIL